MKYFSVFITAFVFVGILLTFSLDKNVFAAGQTTTVPFSCRVTSGNTANVPCVSTFTCPAGTSVKSIRAVADLENAAATASDLQGAGQNKLTVIRPSDYVWEGLAKIGSVSAQSGNVSLSSLIGKTSAQISCKENDRSSAMDCNIRGEAVCGAVSVSAPCAFNGRTIPHGSSTIAFFKSTVPAGQTCTQQSRSQTRTCTNGALSGTYTFPSCTVMTFGRLLPVVSITSSDPNAGEAAPLNPGNFTVTRTGAKTTALPVNLTAMSGTAAQGADYTLSGRDIVGTTVTIPKGSASTVVTLTPVNDILPEATETAVAKLAAKANYTVGSPNVATVNIADNDSASASCTFNGTPVAHNASVTAYQKSTVPAEGTCATEQRTCTNGKLSGTYTFGSCSVGTAPTTLANKVILKDKTSPAMLLWGRHSPKAVKAGNYIYAALEPSVTHPATVNIYKLDTSKTNAIWEAVWNGPTNSHQPPSLTLDNKDRLHLIYPYNVVGTVEHYIFDNASSGNIKNPKRVDTLVWGDKNFYFGVAQFGGSTFLCNYKDHVDTFRCGIFRNDAWFSPEIIATPVASVYLYPNILPLSERTYVVTSSAYPRTVPDSPSGDRVKTMLFGRADDGKTNMTDWTVTLGNISNSTHGFDSDIESDPQNVYVLFRQYGNNEDFVFVFDKNTGVLTAKRAVPGGGSLKYYSGALYAFASGAYYKSTDQAKTWTKYSFELAGFPKKDYFYRQTPTVKARSGSEETGLFALQEVSNKATNKSSVISIEIDPSAIPPVVTCTDCGSSQTASVIEASTMFETLRESLNALKAALLQLFVGNP